jgi:hypothetical protein
MKGCTVLLRGSHSLVSFFAIETVELARLPTIGKIAPELVFMKLGSYEHKLVIVTAKAESPIS